MAKSIAKPYQPDEQEYALLLVAMIHKKEEEIGREITRLRLAEITLERLWSRQRPPDQFLEEVRNWLFRAGWVLFYAGRTFAVVKVETVEAWPRLSSKGMTEVLKKVARREYDFSQLYPILTGLKTDDV